MMKKIFAMLLMLMLCVGLVSVANAATYTGTTGDCTWLFDESTGVLTISGSGAIANYPSVAQQPWHDYQSDIVAIVIEDGVTSIGHLAFSGCANLTSVMISDSVKLVGNYAFNNCTSLTTVVYNGTTEPSGSINVFSGSALNEIQVPTAYSSETFLGMHVTRIPGIGGGDEAVSYNVSVSANPAEGGTVNGAGEYEAGKTVTLTATAKNGYYFVNWTENGTQVSNEANYSFAASEDRTLVANFEEKKYPIKVSAVNGRVTDLDIEEEKEGEAVSFKVQPAEGYELDRVTYRQGDGEPIGVEMDPYGWYTFTMPAGEVTIEPIFKVAPSVYYNVWVEGVQLTDLYTSGDGWEYIPGTNTLSLTGGADIHGVNPENYAAHAGAGVYYGGADDKTTFTIQLTKDTTNKITGYSSASVYPTGIKVDSGVDLVIKGEGSLVVSAEAPADLNNGNGCYAIRVQNDMSITDGATVTATATTEGKAVYAAALWTENGKITIGEGTTVKARLNYGGTDEAEATAAIYVKEAVINAEGTTVEAIGDTKAIAADSITVTPAADSKVTLNTAATADGATKTNEFPANWEIYKYIRIEPGQWTYKITGTANPDEGGSVTGDGNYPYGENVTLTATANEGYTFVNWTEDGTEVCKEADYTFNVSGNRNLAANFKRVYTINYVLDGGTINGEYVASYAFGDSVSLPQNVTREGYIFAGWYDAAEGGNGAIMGVDRTESGDKTFYARWTPNTYTVVWQNDDGNELEKDENVPYGTIPSYDGETPVKAATAQYSYRFVGWDKEPVDVTGNAVYKAVYVRNGNSYTVRYVPNGGAGDPVTVSVPYGDYTLSLCNFAVPSGMRFRAWMIDGVEYAPKTVVKVAGDVTIQPVWEPVPADVPKTGDDSRLSLWLSLMLLSGTALLLLKKEKHA